MVIWLVGSFYLLLLDFYVYLCIYIYIFMFHFLKAMEKKKNQKKCDGWTRTINAESMNLMNYLLFYIAFLHDNILSKKLSSDITKMIIILIISLFFLCPKINIYQLIYEKDILTKFNDFYMNISIILK